MKLSTAVSEVEHIGSVRSLGSFQIDLTAKTVAVLSSTLYRDKTRAILREIGTNAYDAHVDKGVQNRPIEVHLPNSLEPFLSIRDFGYGISPDDMIIVYRRYFASTKTHSNDFVGALGLGSKSPLSKVNAFTVVSIYRSVKRTYDVFLNPQGIPDLSQRGYAEIVGPIEISDWAWLAAFEPVVNDGNREEDGLEVIIPVASAQDFREYRQKAEEVYRYYPVRPTITGSDFSFYEPDILMSGEGWRLTDDGLEARAIMGVVAYPIESECLSADPDLTVERRAVLENILNSSIEIEFEIGDLDFTAGRETLSYDKQTAERAFAAINRIADELAAETQKKFYECETLREAKQLYWKLFRSPDSRSIGRILGADFPMYWNGETITDPNIIIDLYEDFPSTSITVYKNSKRGSHRHSVIFKRDYDDKYKTDFLLTATDNYRILFRDLEKGFKPRIWSWRLQNPKNMIILIQCDDEEEMERLTEYLDGYDIEMVSDLPKPVGTQRTSYRAERSKAHVRALNPSTALDKYLMKPSNENYWRDSTIDFHEDGGAYVVTNRGEIENWGTQRFGEVLRYAARAGLVSVDDLNVVAVSKTAARKVMKSPLWVDFFDHIKSLAENKISPELFSKMADKDSYRGFTHKHSYINLIAIKNVASELNKKHPLFVFGAELGRQDALSDFSDFRILCNILGIALPEPVKNNQMNERWDEICKRYPLLSYIFLDTSAVPYDKIIEYINMVDDCGSDA